MSKLWSLLCYFLSIKRQLFTSFHSQTDGQTDQQNSIIKVYLCVFVNWEQNNWAKLLSMTEFAYNNAKNASIGHTQFELNCRYHPWVSFKDKCNARSKSFSANELAIELKELIDVYC